MYMNAAFGSPEEAKKAILVDFFRFGIPYEKLTS
jgi:hypothetical protein